MLLAALLALAMLATAAPTTNADVPILDEFGEKPYDFDRWIVGFHATPTVNVGDLLYGAPVVAVDSELNYAVVKTLNPAAVQAAAIADPAVRYVEWDNPLYATVTFTPNDPLWSNAGHWGAKKIGATTAWDRTRGTTSIKVGMLDTGLLKAHQDIQRELQGYDFYNGDTDPNEISACGYHGTHTSGTAGATINNGVGIAGMSQHSILPVRAFGGTGCGGSLTALANGLRYMRDQGAHISSNSWGSSASSSTLNSAIDYAHGGGVIHIGAAGNSGPCSNCVSYPWRDRASTVIVVSSTTSSDGLSSFSSTGPQVDVAAPGSSIISTCGPNTNSYCTYSGTSMATPHVAGTAALIKALHPTWGFTSVDSQLKNTALDLGAAGFDNSFGYGRIRASNAVV